MSNSAVPAWAPGTISLAFFYVGQGDCCVAKLPNGKVMVVDGGSTSDFEVDPDLVNIRRVLKAWCKSGVVDYLVLTHPDQDHYNKLPIILDEFKTNYVFLSCATPVKNYPTSLYYVGNVDGYLRWDGWGVKYIIDVSLNQRTDAVTIWESSTKFRTPVDLEDGIEYAALPKFLRDQIDPTNGLLDNNYLKVDEGANWRVSLIAGNVGLGEYDTRGAITEAWRNRASLVTRLRINQSDNQVALLHGDADIETLTYILSSNNLSGLGISSAEVMHVPHHGSETGYLQDYLNLVDPQYGVISVKLGEYGNRLPDQGVVTGILNKMNGQGARRITMVTHTVDYWVPFPSAAPVWAIIDDWLTAGEDVWVSLKDGGGERKANKSYLGKVWGRYFILGDYSSFAPNTYYMAIPAYGKALYTTTTQRALQQTGRAVPTSGIINFNLDGK